MLRGINTTADFFVDGVRDDAQYFRDLYNAERIEVLKGPGGMSFGRGGAGGVINRVTKRPTFAAQAAADLTLGSHDQRRATADVGNRIGDSAAWRLNAMGERADSFRDGVTLKRWAINPTATLLTGENSSLTVGYEHLDDERTADRGIPSRNGRPFVTDEGRFFGNAAQSISDAKVDSATAVFEHRFANGVQLKNSFRAAHYDKFYQNVFANGAVDAAGNVNLAAYNNASELDNVFNQTDLVAKFAAGRVQHTVLGGLEVGHQKVENRRLTGRFNGATSIAVPASNPFATASSFSASASDANNQVTADIAALYVQDQVTLGEQWKVLAGVRYDRFKVAFDDRRAGNQDLARTDNEVSPRLGLVWQPTAASTYYASYSTSFLPSAETLSLAANTAQMAPESAINYEVGARWDLAPALTLSAAAFRTDRDDVKSVDPGDPTRTRLVQTGVQRTEGVELGLQGEVTRAWQVYAGYANLDARIEQTTQSAPAGRTVGLVPQHAAAVWNKVDFDAQWGAGLGVIYQSAMYTSFNNTVRLPSFTRMDGAVYYRFTEGKTRLALNLENLLDKRYYPTAHNDNNISTGAPRSAQLTLSTRF